MHDGIPSEQVLDDQAEVILGEQRWRRRWRTAPAR
jgi:hypothetical protein